jgi:hypothetical protein
MTTWTTRGDRVAETVAVELKITDEEPFRLFVKGAGESAGMFATLTEAERDALPQAALFGIARLRGAIAEFTGDPDSGNPGTPATGDVPASRCQSCQDTGHVCEEHPDRLWGGMCCDAAGRGAAAACEHGACGCGAPGMPCPACCSPVPEDGRRSITDAFVPDWMRSAEDVEALISKEIA